MRSDGKFPFCVTFAVHDITEKKGFLSTTKDQEELHWTHGWVLLTTALALLGL